MRPLLLTPCHLASVFPPPSHTTLNVEYNQLDPLLRATTQPQGDVNDATGFSPFPGAPGFTAAGWRGRRGFHSSRGAVGRRPRRRG